MTGAGPLAAAGAGNAAVAGAVYIGLVCAGVAVSIILLVRGRMAPRAPAPAPVSPLPPRPAFVLFTALFALQIALAIVLPGILRAVDPPDPPDAYALVLQSLLFHGVILVFVGVALARSRRNGLEAFGVRLPRIVRRAGLSLAFYLAALPHVVVYGLAARGVLSLAGYEFDVQPALRILLADQPPWVRAYLVGLGVVLAPVAEEILFRGIALPLLARRIGAAPAVIAVSAIFSALHFHVPSLVPLFVIGVAFSLAYLHTGDLAVPVIMHAVFNAVNIGMLFYLGGPA